MRRRLPRGAGLTCNHLGGPLEQVEDLPRYENPAAMPARDLLQDAHVDQPPHVVGRGAERHAEPFLRTGDVDRGPFEEVVDEPRLLHLALRAAHPFVMGGSKVGESQGSVDDVAGFHLDPAQEEPHPPFPPTGNAG